MGISRSGVCTFSFMSSFYIYFLLYHLSMCWFFPGRAAALFQLSTAHSRRLEWFADSVWQLVRFFINEHEPQRTGQSGGAATRRGTHALHPSVAGFVLIYGREGIGSGREYKGVGCSQWSDEYFLSGLWDGSARLGSIRFCFISLRFRFWGPSDAPPAALMKIIYYAMPFN